MLNFYELLNVLRRICHEIVLLGTKQICVIYKHGGMIPLLNVCFVVIPCVVNDLEHMYNYIVLLVIYYDHFLPLKKMAYILNVLVPHLKPGTLNLQKLFITILFVFDHVQSQSPVNTPSQIDERTKQRPTLFKAKINLYTYRL